MNNAGESHCYHCGEEGHWVRDCPHHVAVPKSVIDRNKTVTLAADVFFVYLDGVPDDSIKKHQVYHGGVCRNSYC